MSSLTSVWNRISEFRSRMSLFPPLKNRSGVFHGGVVFPRINALF